MDIASRSTRLNFSGILRGDVNCAVDIAITHKSVTLSDGADSTDNAGGRLKSNRGNKPVSVKCYFQHIAYIDAINPAKKRSYTDPFTRLLIHKGSLPAPKRILYVTIHTTNGYSKFFLCRFLVRFMH